MANSFDVQVLSEGSRNAVIKLTGVLTSSDLPLTTAVDITTLNQGGIGPTPTAVRIDYIDYSIADQLEVQLLWDATTPKELLPIAGRGRMPFNNFGGLQNNAGAGKNGNIKILTTGYTSGTQVFSVILELVKQGPVL
jgi:hypothetical protein